MVTQQGSLSLYSGILTKNMALTENISCYW
jgi:hypothetical protein